MSRRPGREVRRRKGCDTCRSNKVKCDEGRPSCTRCIRLERRCSWPELEPSLSVLRRGRGTIRARESRWAPAVILPAGSPVAADTSARDRFSSLSGPESLPSVHSMLDYDDLWMDLGIELSESTWSAFPELPDNEPLWSRDIFRGTNHLEEMPSVACNTFWSPALDLSDYHIQLPNSMLLNPSEHHALGHYQTVFSIYRTTKDPKWSTHKLLLDFAAHNEMIMHFILAVSINDVSHRQDQISSTEAQAHFEAGAEILIEMIQKNSPSDYLYVMSAFLFLYLYMPKRESVPKKRIQQLSSAVLNYVKSHRLDSLCLEQGARVDDLFGPPSLSSRDRNILARLIIWTFDEDVKCGFQGSGGDLARYLTAHRERTMAVYEVSRTALEAHWGATYPESQISDDVDNSVELEFLWALTALWQDINEIAHIQSPDTESCQNIKKRFTLLEKKYASVFQNSSTSATPRTRVHTNADFDVILFNALQVYYFRATVSELGIESPPEVQSALKRLLHLIQRTFASNSNELHDRLQWPLFMAGIETDDGIYREWIMSRLSRNRARYVLQKSIEIQSITRKRLAMHEIRSLLFEDQTEQEALSMESYSFLDMIRLA